MKYFSHKNIIRLIVRPPSHGKGTATS